MVVRLADFYFVDPEEPDPIKVTRKTKIRKLHIPSLWRRKLSRIEMSRAALEDDWEYIDVDKRWDAFTPYGKGRVLAINKAGTHYRVEFRPQVYRRIILKNCLTKMKLADYGRQKTYAVDKDVVSTTGRPYRGVIDDLRHIGADPVVLEQLCALNGIDYDRYRHLGPGHQRMCIGNVLRNRIRKGEKVTLGFDAASGLETEPS